MALRDFVAKVFKPVANNSFFQTLGVPQPMSTMDQINSYRGVVYACVSAISEEVGKITIKTLDSKGKEINSPILDLFHNPNFTQRMTQYNLFEMTQTYIELTGECFWYMGMGENSKLPKIIFILNPSQMTVVPGENGSIKGYVFTNNAGEKVPLELNEVIHFKMPNPTNPFRGLGTVQAAMTYIQTETYASQFTRNSLFNNAKPAGIITINGTIDEKDFKEVKRQWSKEYGQISNAGKVAFLRKADATYTQVGMGLGELAMKDLKGMSRDDIMFMFRVSKPILGIVEDVSLNNAKSSNYIFMQRVIYPKMERIIDTLQSALGDVYKVTFTFDDPVEEDLAEKASFYEKVIDSVMTRNEAREELDLDPIPGGDQLYVPLNLMPIGTKVPPKDQKGKATMKKTTKTTYRKLKKEEKNEEIVNVLDRDLMNWKAYDQFITNWIPKYKDALDTILSQEEALVVGKLKGKKKDYEEDLPDKEDLVAKWVAVILPIVFEVTKARAKMTAEQLGSGDFDFTPAMEESIRKNLGNIAGEFTDQTQEFLRETLKDGYEAGETMAELADRVGDVYKGAKDWRSERLARTETKRTADRAALDMAKQSGVVAKKQWYANPNACGECSAMDGTVVDIDANFLDFRAEVKYEGEDSEGNTIEKTFVADYEDVDMPDLHPNCMCDYKWIVGE